MLLSTVVLIDWDGNIYLCPQDWQRRVSMGNLMQETIFKIWTGRILTKFRKDLLSGNRCNNPCKNVMLMELCLVITTQKMGRDFKNLIF